MCRNGNQRVSRWILRFSKFFHEQLERLDQYNSELKFMYRGYAVETIRTFFNLVHGIDQDEIKLHVSLELLKFLKCEGKTKVIKGIPVSPLEHEMYTTIHNSIEKACLPLEDMVLVCLFLSQIEGYNGKFFKVCFTTGYENLTV